ncbi:MAG: glycosyltransferase family 4 protein [Deltaproteobacteria bacterium]|nr:glycosyltransferase family 4 protein [Deltaproteobacteria bacterium]
MRILFVAMANSVHTARWINQLNGRGWDIHLFPVTSVEEFGISTELKETTVHHVLFGKQNGWHPSVREVDDFWPFLKNGWPLSRGSYRARRLVERWIPAWKDRTWALAQTIRKLRPDIIHSLEFQHGAYPVLDARRHLIGKFPPWIVTNWGSDIYLFGRLAEHAERVRAVLASCNYYWCECKRDVGLARSFGFNGEVLPVLPIAGGYEVARFRQLRQPGLISERRLILLKGYGGWAGRALVGLRALELSAAWLKGYRVAVYLASPETKIAAELVSQSTGIPLDIIPPCSHEEMLRLHGQARVSIGLSISDAISTSLLEAMIMGSFPIQSRTSCGDEWLQCGKTGILVHPEDPEGIAKAITRAVSDDTLVDQAAEINAQVAADRLDRCVIEPQVKAMYEKIAAENPNGDAILNRAAS